MEFIIFIGGECHSHKSTGVVFRSYAGPLIRFDRRIRIKFPKKMYPVCVIIDHALLIQGYEPTVQGTSYGWSGPILQGGINLTDY